MHGASCGEVDVNSLYHSPDNPPIEWTEEEQRLVPIEQRRFGPHFEKPCRNPDTIVCAARSCQAAYRCRWGAVA
jgi:hypothetical protein